PDRSGRREGLLAVVGSALDAVGWMRAVRSDARARRLARPAQDRRGARRRGVDLAAVVGPGWRALLGERSERLVEPGAGARGHTGDRVPPRCRVRVAALDLRRVVVRVP